MKYLDIIVVLILIFASLMDIKFKKVSNIYLLCCLMLGLCLKRYEFLISALICLLFTYILYHLGFFGAADIKLISILCGFLGFSESLYIVFIACVFASIYSLYYMLSKKILFERINYFLHYSKMSLQTKKVYKYNEGLDKNLLMPMVPWLLLAFLVWRLYQIIWT